MDGIPPDEQIPDLGTERIPAGCQLDLYGGFGRRMSVESYDDVVAKIEAAGPSDQIELRVLSGRGPDKSEVVRWTVDAQLIGAVLEITDALEERWKEFEEEDAQSPVVFSLPMGPGGGGFRLE